MPDVIDKLAADSTESPATRRSMEYNRTLTQLEALRTRTEFISMRLTPWQDIWTSMALARRRGHTHMAEALYDALIQGAVFDDRGAWSLKTPRHG